MMRSLLRALSLAAILLMVAVARGEDPTRDPDAYFEIKIRPVLVKSCAGCHGVDKASQGLRVDSRAALLQGGESGSAVVPGDPAGSLLMQAIRRDGLEMPPEQPLAPDVIADFEHWIKTGAVWPESRATSDAFSHARHWAFQPVENVVPPDDPTGWSTSAVDRFVSAEHRAHHVAPVGPASKRHLVRRVFFDLIGLPPEPDEVDDFLADDAPDAFERLVDRLLASPQYGERWGRYWMDVVRYADTAGDNADYPVPEVRRYRDYIIDAFNADKPYDQFVREQLAGDILAAGMTGEIASEQIAATGFVALSRRYATAPYELMHLTLEDTIDTTGRAFLGLTLRCARCHDHKFDPVTAKDYYGLYAIFASTKFPYAGSEEFQSMRKARQGFVPLVAADVLAVAVQEQSAEAEELKTKIEALRNEKAPKKEIDALDRKLRAFELAGLPLSVSGAYAVADGPPVPTRVQLRGEPGEPGDAVDRAVPAFLAGDHPPVFPEGTSGRAQLAEWITRADHPLTARVFVNRVWQHQFGSGIVTTPSNFGLSGAAPTHSKLLDWLAARFVTSGWSVKALQREIVCSATYQLACDDHGENAKRDPGSAWLWRHERRRLDAEALRDAMLDVAGVLDEARGGAHPFPPIEKWNWTQHTPFLEMYESDHRSVYLMTQRIKRHPYLALFDGPDTNTTTEQRSVSTVPLQALYLMNSSVVRDLAEQFAARLARESADPAARIRLAHRLAYAREGSEEELTRGLRYLDAYREESLRAGADGDGAEHDAWLSYCRTLLAADEFLYID